MEINQKTQTDIINDPNFNKSAVSTWYNGTRLPRMDNAEALEYYRENYGCYMELDGYLIMFEPYLTVIEKT